MIAGESGHQAKGERRSESAVESAAGRNPLVLQACNS